MKTEPIPLEELPEPSPELISALSERGKAGAEAGAALRKQMLSDLRAPTEAARAELDRLGVELPPVSQAPAPKPAKRKPAQPDQIVRLTSDEARGLARARMEQAEELSRAALKDGEAMDLDRHWELLRQAQALLAVADPRGEFELIARQVRP